MTKVRTCGLFTFVLAQSRKVNTSEKASLPAMICTVFLFCVAAAIAMPAQSIAFSTLASFDGTDGAGPFLMSLVRGTDGNFYGTTAAGGANNSCTGGCGVVFKITPAGALTTPYSFCSRQNCIDGSGPYAGLVQGSDGNFYGTTYNGGTIYNGVNPNCPGGCGTVFKITPAGTLTTLYSFCSQLNCADGEHPESALVQGSDGNFYGTTSVGGANGDWGTVFKITSSGMLSTLYSFCSQPHCTDGAQPLAGLLQASDGNFYGTTLGGGVPGQGGQGGTVFKITSSGTLTTLYSFCAQNNCTDGETPSAGLVQASDGNFYGTTEGGGANGPSRGTVFKVTPAGTLTTLYSFCSQPNCADGETPYAPLVQAADGNFYGTTYSGGAYNCGLIGCGTVFKITPAGVLTTLHDFDSTDGGQPAGGLMQAANGFFYGTTGGGGAYGDGTVIRLLPVR